MPIEIKELHIRVTVTEPAHGSAKAPPRGAAGAAGAHPGEGAGRDELVAECVGQVLQILQANKER